MSKIFSVLKILIQLFKCLSCAHKCDCNQSLYIKYKGIEYLLTVEKKGGDNNA